MITRLSAVAGSLFILLLTAVPCAAGPKYFGYFGSDYIGGCGSTPCGQLVAGYTNVVWLDSSTSDLATQIAIASGRGQKTILHLFGSFFIDGRLRPDLSGAIAQLVNQLQDQVPNLAALYPLDEPFSHDMVDGEGHQISTADRAADVVTLYAALHAAFPQIPIAVTFSTGDLSVPEVTNVIAMVDWFGFDCYRVACSTSDLDYYVGVLEGYRSGAQRLFLVPDASFFPGMQIDSGSIATLLDRISYYVSTLSQDPYVIGLFPYVYGTYTDESGTTTGAEDLPAVETAYENAGAAIVVAQPAPSMWVDIPGNGGIVYPTFRIAGWAIDAGSPAGPGIDSVQIWAWPTGGGDPVFLGVATYGSLAPVDARPDVAAIFGRQFLGSDFNLFTNPIPPGQYTVVVYAHSAVTGTYNDQQSVQLNVVGSFAMYGDLPTANATVPTTFQIAGWAIDRLSPSGGGTGIDAVEVYAYQNGTPLYLGDAEYGYERPDVAAVYGSQFTDCGYNMLATLAPGAYELVIYAHSHITGLFSDPVVIWVTVTS